MVGEGDAGGSGEQAGVVVGGAVLAVLDQVSMAGVGCRVDPSRGVSGEIWMVAGGLEDPGVAVTECGSFHVPAPGLCAASVRIAWWAAARYASSSRAQAAWVRAVLMPGVP
jgi:hypothetical protein